MQPLSDVATDLLLQFGSEIFLFGEASVDRFPYKVAAWFDPRTPNKRQAIQTFLDTELRDLDPGICLKVRGRCIVR